MGQRKRAPQKAKKATSLAQLEAKEWITLPEAQLYLMQRMGRPSLSHVTLRAWIKERGLPVRRLSPRVIITRTQWLDEWLAIREVAPKSTARRKSKPKR